MKTVNDYISTFPDHVRSILEKVRFVIKKAAPEAEEVISYGMPAYKYHGILVYFAAYKNHIGLYATPTGHEKFAEQLSAYKQGKGSVQFPIAEDMPLELISKMVKFRMQENIERQKTRKKP